MHNKIHFTVETTITFPCIRDTYKCIINQKDRVFITTHVMLVVRSGHTAEIAQGRKLIAESLKIKSCYGKDERIPD